MLDVHNVPVDWGAYRFREGFTLFEVTCLLHRLEPRAVFDDAHHAIRRHGGPAAEVLRSPAATAELFHLNPDMFFIPPVGDTLERLKRAAGSRLGLLVNADRARALAAMLGVPYPPELEREAPAADPVPAPGAAQVLAGGTLKTAQLAEAFDGIAGVSADKWRKRLGDLNNHAWLSPARATTGAAPNPATWWPLKFAELLLGRGCSEDSLNRAFLAVHALKPWLHGWQEARRERNAFGQ